MSSRRKQKLLQLESKSIPDKWELLALGWENYLTTSELNNRTNQQDLHPVIFFFLIYMKKKNPLLGKKYLFRNPLKGFRFYNLNFKGQFQREEECVPQKEEKKSIFAVQNKLFRKMINFNQQNFIKHFHN